jgi:hypothetical protein
MDIKSVTEFRNFILLKNLIDLHPLIKQLQQCVTNYEKACSCLKKSYKEIMYNECKKMYETIVPIIISELKVPFINNSPSKQIRFYQDGKLLGTIV